MTDVNIDPDGVLAVDKHRPSNESTDEHPPDAIRELSSFQRDVLFVVAGAESPSGQEIKRELEATTMEMVLPGQLYPNLADLADRDLVEKHAKDGRTSAYELTEDGSTVLGELCRWQLRRIQADASPVPLDHLPSV